MVIFFDSKVFKKWKEEQRWVGSTSNPTSKRTEKHSPKPQVAGDQHPQQGLCGSSISPKCVPEPQHPLSVITENETITKVVELLPEFTYPIYFQHDGLIVSLTLSTQNDIFGGLRVFGGVLETRL